MKQGLHWGHFSLVWQLQFLESHQQPPRIPTAAPLLGAALLSRQFLILISRGMLKQLATPAAYPAPGLILTACSYLATRPCVTAYKSWRSSRGRSEKVKMKPCKMQVSFTPNTFLCHWRGCGKLPWNKNKEQWFCHSAFNIKTNRPHDYCLL